MNKETYYNLLKEYQTIISQKQFNPYLCDRKKLEEVKEKVIRQLRKNIINVAMNIVDEQKGRMPKDPNRETKLQRMKNLMAKIENEEPITETDYTETYYIATFLFGLTLHQFLIVGAISAAIAIAITFLYNH